MHHPNGGWPWNISAPSTVLPISGGIKEYKHEYRALINSGFRWGFTPIPLSRPRLRPALQYIELFFPFIYLEQTLKPCMSHITSEKEPPD